MKRLATAAAIALAAIVLFATAVTAGYQPHNHNCSSHNVITDAVVGNIGYGHSARVRSVLWWEIEDHLFWETKNWPTGTWKYTGIDRGVRTCW